MPTGSAYFVSEAARCQKHCWKTPGEPKLRNTEEVY